MIVSDPHELTPVQKLGGVYFKRDDLFQPFAEPLNGSKVRQALSMLSANHQAIKTRHHNTVVTISSIHSPQGYLIARCAASMGIKTVIGIGTSKPEMALRFKPFDMAVNVLGAKILKLAGVGWNNVLHARLKIVAKENGWFPIKFGIEGDLSANAAQAANLPEGLDHLILPIGSGVTASAVLQGLGAWPASRRHALPKTIHCVQISGLHRMIRSPLKYKFIIDRTYKYATQVDVTHHGLTLDSIYEAKAFAWMQRAKLRGSACFYVIGDFNNIRH